MCIRVLCLMSVLAREGPRFTVAASPRYAHQMAVACPSGRWARGQGSPTPIAVPCPHVLLRRPDVVAASPIVAGDRGLFACPDVRRAPSGSGRRLGHARKCLRRGTGATASPLQRLAFSARRDSPPGPGGAGVLFPATPRSVVIGSALRMFLRGSGDRRRWWG